MKDGVPKSIQRWVGRCERAVSTGEGLPRRGWLRREIPVGYRGELYRVVATADKHNGVFALAESLTSQMREATTDTKFQVRLLAYLWFREELAAALGHEPPSSGWFTRWLRRLP